MTAYPTNTEAMAQYLSTQYTNKPINQHNGKKGIKIREMIQNLKAKTATHVTPQVHTLEILQQLKNPLLLAEVLVLALIFWKQMYSCPVHCVLWRRFWEHTPWMMMISGVTLIPLTYLLTQRIAKKWWQEALSQNCTHTNTKNQFHMSY